MNFKKTIKIGCVIGVLSISTMVLAKNPPTTCPSVNLVKQSASELNDAFPIFGNYEVITDQPVLHVDNYAWAIAVVPILETTPEAAIAKAKQVVTTVSEVTDAPTRSDMGYSCAYAAKDSNVYTFTADPDVNISKPFIPKTSN